MVKANFETLFRVYKFGVKFGFGEKREPLELGFQVAAMTARGLEFWRAIRPGEMLIDLVEFATDVEVTLTDKRNMVKRVITFSVSDVEYLPFGVGLELGGQRIGRLDAMMDEVALEGVVFRTILSRTVTESFADCRRFMVNTLKCDEGLREGYVANVAMLLHDCYGITDHEIRNEAAEAILTLIFENRR